MNHKTNNLDSFINELAFDIMIGFILQTITRQVSLERRWDDVQDLLGVQLDSNNTLPTSADVPPTAPHFGGVTSSQGAYDVTNGGYGGGSQGALLQNATMGAPAINTTELLAAAIGKKRLFDFLFQIV